MPIKTIIKTTLLVMSLTLILASNSKAANVTHTIEALNLKASGDYLPGSKQKPAILILHGFLTTNKFHTVVSMAKAMHDEGHSVLSPTLSLNINKRKNSIKCNSIHAHTLKNDIDEVHAWIDWLENKGYQEVILVGHSAGSLSLLEYAKEYSDTRVKAIIFTSMFYLNGKEMGIIPAEVELAQTLLKSKKSRPHKYNFLFCKNNYLATPESFLSYLKLDRNYVLNSMTNLNTPHYSIMGGADKRYKKVGLNWLNELESTGTKLITIDGANHFFSSEYEFDLQDELTSILSELER